MRIYQRFHQINKIRAVLRCQQNNWAKCSTHLTASGGKIGIVRAVKRARYLALIFDLIHREKFIFMV